RDDAADSAKASKIADERVRHPVGEILLRGIAGEILQRQYGDRSDARLRPETRSKHRSGNDRCHGSRRCDPSPTQRGAALDTAQIGSELACRLITVLGPFLQTLQDHPL